MTPAAMRTRSANQIAGQFLASISHMPDERQLDRITDMLNVTFDRELRAPMLRRFNDLAEREVNAPAAAKLTEEEVT